MEKFVVQFHGGYIDLPYVEDAADGEKQNLRSYLIRGTETASGKGYDYCYTTLRLVFKKKAYGHPESFYHKGVIYHFLDHHAEWQSLLREKGGKIVRKQIPLLALYGISPEKVLDKETFCKLSNLPEFQNKGRLTVVFYIGTQRYDAIFENDLMQKYQRKMVFTEENAALFMMNEYRFWIDGGNEPKVYFTDELKYDMTAPFIDVTDCQEPLIVGKDALKELTDSIFRNPEVGHILRKASYAIPLRDYTVEAELVPPFASKNGYCFGRKSRSFSEDEVHVALPLHVWSIMEEEARRSERLFRS